MHSSACSNESNLIPLDYSTNLIPLDYSTKYHQVRLIYVYGKNTADHFQLRAPLFMEV